jgi:hypothetical protein
MLSKPMAGRSRKHQDVCPMHAIADHTRFPASCPWAFDEWKRSSRRTTAKTAPRASSLPSAGVARNRRAKLGPVGLEPTSETAVARTPWRLALGRRDTSVRHVGAVPGIGRQPVAVDAVLAAVGNSRIGATRHDSRRKHTVQMLCILLTPPTARCSVGGHG